MRYWLLLCQCLWVWAVDLTCEHDTIMTISIDRDMSEEAFNSILGVPNENFLRNHFNLDEEGIVEYMMEATEFFEEEYGVIFNVTEYRESWLSEDGYFLLEATSISTADGLPGPTIFRTMDSRMRRDECVLVPDGGAGVISLGGGKWGGNWGKENGYPDAQPFEAVLVGTYIIPGGLNPKQRNGCDLHLDYHSFAPMESTPYGSVTLNCDVESVIGNGRIVGAFRATSNGDGTIRMRDHQTIHLDN